MSERTLQRCRVLVVEDEYLLADDLSHALSDAGALVIGPAPTVDEALGLVDAEREIDGAVLDVNLGGTLVFPVADALIARGVPWVFTTGYDVGVIPARYRHVTRCEKPVNVAAVARAIGREMG